VTGKKKETINLAEERKLSLAKLLEYHGCSGPKALEKEGHIFLFIAASKSVPHVSCE
jgi:hypothetical protein